MIAGRRGLEGSRGFASLPPSGAASPGRGGGKGVPAARRGSTSALPDGVPAAASLAAGIGDMATPAFPVPVNSAGRAGGRGISSNDRKASAVPGTGCAAGSWRAGALGVTSLMPKTDSIPSKTPARNGFCTPVAAAGAEAFEGAEATMILGSLGLGPLQSLMPSAMSSAPRSTLYSRVSVPSLACTEAG